MRLDSDVRAMKWFKAAAVVAVMVALFVLSVNLEGVGATISQGDFVLVVLFWIAVGALCIWNAWKIMAPSRFIRAHLAFSRSAKASSPDADAARQELIETGLKILKRRLTPLDAISVATAVVSKMADLSDDVSPTGSATKDAADFGAQYVPMLVPGDRDTQGLLTPLAEASCGMLALLGQLHLALGDSAVARGLAERAPLMMQDLTSPNLWSCMWVRSMAYAFQGRRDEAERDYGRLYAADPSRTEDLKLVYDAIND